MTVRNEAVLLTLVLSACKVYKVAAGSSLATDSTAVPGAPVPVYNNMQFLDTKYYGIWDRSDACPTVEACPFVRGYAAQFLWKSFEPQKGTYDFGEVDQILEKAYKGNRSFYAMMFVGPDSPDWIYTDPEHPVPKSSPKVRSEDRWDYYPYYLSSNYATLRNNMIRVWAKYLREHKYAEAIGFVQANYGCTGDPVLYKSAPSDSQYSITAAQETQHQYQIWEVYADAFQNRSKPGPVIPVLANAESEMDDPATMAKLMETFTGGIGIKGSAYVRGHHLSTERSWIEKWRSNVLNCTGTSSKPFFFTRAEMDQTWKKAVGKINYKIQFHWGVINGLNQGLGVHDVSFDAIVECAQHGYCESFDFFNLYAPQIWPHNSTNAFIALHEGLDWTNRAKFPETLYGAYVDTGLKQQKVTRITNICKAHAAFGCKVDDMEAATKLNQVYQRDEQTGYNDVGGDIWERNYGRWIEQIDADVTSQGLFRIGGKINSTTSKYARFARGLIHNSNKKGMYFKFSDGFFSVVSPGNIKMQMIWYDNAAGSFQVRYKRGNTGPVVIALNQPCSGSKQWKNTSFELNMMKPGACERGSDFYIVSDASTDVIVHLIEAARVFQNANVNYFGDLGEQLLSTSSCITCLECIMLKLSLVVFWSAISC